MNKVNKNITRDTKVSH